MSAEIALTPLTPDSVAHREREREFGAPGGLGGLGALESKGFAWTLTLAALLLAALPYLTGFLAAPRGLVFLGALNNVGDTGQYLAALRQGAEGHLLYVNQYTSLRVAPVLMYPLYTAAGALLAPLHVPVMGGYLLLRLVAAVALLAALWQLGRAALPGGARLAYVVALWGGSLYVPALLLSPFVRLPVAPVALTAPEFTVFTTLLVSPHGALGLAAELWAFSGYLRWRREGFQRGLAALAAGGLVLGLCYPFGLIGLLAVVAVDSMLSIRTLHSSPAHAAHAARGRGVSEEALVALALLPAGAIALYYAVLFRHDPLWSASNMLRLPPPGVAVLLGAFGPLLTLALPAVRRLHAEGGAGGRLVVTWAVVNPALLLLPLPQSERLLSGWSVALALLAAATLGRVTSSRRVRRIVAALSLSTVMLPLLYLTVTLHASNPAYYAPTSEDAAVRWLAAHSGRDDVVMASAGSGNLIVAAAACRVVVGQNFETFHWAAAQRDVLRYYAATTGTADRAAILRRQHVTLVLAGPYERALGAYVPAGPTYRLVHRDGPVRVYAVENERGAPGA